MHAFMLLPMQDVYRRLSCPQASAGVLRMRCSSAFKPARHYGRLYADQQVRLYADQQERLYANQQ